MKKTILTLILPFIFLYAFAENISTIDSLENLESKASGIEKADLLIQLSEAYRNIKFDNCIIYGQKAVVLSKSLKNDDLQGRALKSLGVSCYISSEYEAALDYFEKANKVFERSGNILEQGNCISNIGLIYDEWSEYEKAEEYYNKALKLKTKTNDKSSIAKTLINLGNINYYRKNYKKSLDYYYRAKLLFDDANDMVGVGQCLINIAIIYKKWGNITQAEEYLKDAIAFYSQQKNDFQLSKTYTNLADLYCDYYKDYKTAMDYYNKSLTLKKEMDDTQGIAMVYNNIGSLYGNMEDFGQAVKYFNMSRKLFTRLNSMYGLVMVDQNEGKVAMLQKQYMKAEKLFTRSLENAEGVNLTDYIASNQEYLLKLYAATCDYDQFLTYYKLFITGKDTLLDNLHRAKLAEIEAKYKAEEQLNETLSLRKKTEKSTQTIKQYKLMLAGLLGIIILVTLILSLFWWYKRPR